MKKFIFLICLIFNFCFSQENLELNLKEQTIIDLCNFPNLTEGIVDILYLTVENYWHKGQYSKIFPIFYLITRILPYDVNAYCLGGWFLINGIVPKVSHFEKERIKNFAIKFMKEGIEKNPKDYRLYWEIAWFYYNEGEFEKALEYLDEAENFEHPFYVENLKAQIYMRVNDKEKAIKEWEKIKERYPERKEIAERFIK
ncbi:MAG: tetratricopeptide repeat protein, partial [Candidatus Ratteibacteria bacterium]